MERRSPASPLWSLVGHSLYQPGPRRFALGQIQASLRNTQGLRLEVGDFNYNLVTARIELKHVTLKGLGFDGSARACEGAAHPYISAGVATGPGILQTNGFASSWCSKRAEGNGR